MRRSFHMIRPTARFSFALVCGTMIACSLVTTEAGDTPGVGENTDTVTRILRDWKQRSASIKTLHVEASGTQKYRKGAFDQDDDLPRGFTGTFPAEDCEQPVSSKWWIDFERGYYRLEYRDTVPNLAKSPPAFEPYAMDVLYDGKRVYLVQMATGENDKGPWVRIFTPSEAQTRVPRDGSFSMPLLTGNVAPMGLFDTRVDKLRPSLAPRNLTDAGEATVRGRSVRRIELVKRPPPPNGDIVQGSYTELLVDMERSSLILRANFRERVRRDQWDGTGKPPRPRVVFSLDFQYEQRDGQWRPVGWTSRFNAFPSEPTKTVRVDKWIVNQPIASDTFQPHFPPGTVITDLTGIKKRTYRVDAKGEWVPQE